MHEDPPADGDAECDDEEDDQLTGSDAVTRRRLVASGAAAWATVSLAGCRYITDPGVDTDTPTPTVTTETTTTDTPTPDPNATPTPTPDPDATPTETPTPSPTPTPTPPATTTACESIGEFVPGQEVGLHVGVYDSQTGEPLGDDNLQTVAVEFPEADYGRRELNWRGDHERYDEETWGTKIVTDPAAQPGTYRYEVAVIGDEGEVQATVTNRFTLIG
jgi:hypothetical protein